MKNLILSTFICVILLSCSETFEHFDPDDFNDQIAERTDIETAEDLIMLYYNYPLSESFKNLSIETQQLKDDRVMIVLKHENLEDDSVYGEKLTMVAKKNEKTWIVLEIKRNWKCQEGRGHTSWGKKFCN